MDKPRFMGPEHVARMNELLDGRLRDECASLTRDLHIQYEIRDDPDGIRSWTVVAGPAGLRFALDLDVASPAATIRSSYWSMAEPAAAARDGAEGGEEDGTVEQVVHDEADFATVSRVLEAARPIGTIEVTFPER